MLKLIYFALCSLIFSVICDELSLKQVVILSRHNVRTPLAQNLAQVTPKHWPVWKEKPGFLTQKGAKLEGYMGKFFAAWLREQKLLPNHCPKKQDVYIYANVKQRTRASARAFVEKAFPNCNVTVHYNDSGMDPIFNAVIHNTTVDFRHIALEQMQATLKSLLLNKSYEDINDILDYRNSEMCKKEMECDLVSDVNKVINVQAGLKPNIKGPLKIGNSAVDAFIMEYYEGFNVAWGQLSNGKEWHKLMRISRGYHNVIFNTTAVAKDISSPLLKYMSNIFLNETTNPKMTLLMGHDANMYTLLKGMGFKYYSLPNQYEVAPVGGKIVFQKWYDERNKRYLLKIDYVYQSSKQLRDAVELSLLNPPQFKVLELNHCRLDDRGFCLWDDFVKLLSSLQYLI